MKPIFIYAVAVLFLFLSGCKKNDVDPNPLEIYQENIVGAWLVQQVKYEYFDSSNQKVFERVDTGWFTKTEFNQNGSATFYAPGPNNPYENAVPINYQLTTRDDKFYITIERNGSVSPIMEITELISGSMAWMHPEPDTRYTQNGQEKTAARAVRLIQFAK